MNRTGAQEGAQEGAACMHAGRQHVMMGVTGALAGRQAARDDGALAGRQTARACVGSCCCAGAPCPSPSSSWGCGLTPFASTPPPLGSHTHCDPQPAVRPLSGGRVDDDQRSVPWLSGGLGNVVLPW